MKPDYVFIVGLPRTGTKLVKNVLLNSRSEHFNISSETFFMGHFRNPGLRHQVRGLGDMKNEADVRKLVDYMYSGTFTGTYWKHLKQGTLGVEKENMVRAILATDRSEKEIYRVIMGIHPGTTPATILGDKTPANLYHVPDLLSWFPNARIVHTFRDPRAIMASEWHKRMERVRANYLPFNLQPSNPLYSFMIVAHVTVTWLYAVRLHHKYKTRYPHHYYLLRFEDLVSEPEKYVKALCQFLEIEFDEAMLSPRQVGSSFDRERGVGFDTHSLDRWRLYLKPWMKTWLLLWGKKYLKEFGYIP